MSSETNLELWCDSLYQPTPETTLDELLLKTHAVRAMKAMLPVPELDSMLGLPVSNSFLFCGPSGSGKQTLALATAGSLAASGYQFLRFVGNDFSDRLAEKFQTLFARLSPNQPMLILAEDLTGCADLPNLSVCLGQIVTICRQHKIPMTLIVIHEDEEELPAELRRHLIVCRLTLPDLNERIAFYEALPRRIIPLREGLSARDLANASDGLTLWQLRQTLRFMQLRMKEQALAEYKNHHELAASALRTKAISIDMQDFREIVNHLKAPKKESAAAVQVIQQATPVAAPAFASSSSLPKDHEPTHAERLAGTGSMSDFMDML